MNKTSLRRYQIVAILPLLYLIISLLFSSAYARAANGMEVGDFFKTLDVIPILALGFFSLSAFLAVNAVKGSRFLPHLRQIAAQWPNGVLLFDIACFSIALWLVLLCLNLVRAEKAPVLLNLYFFAAYAGSNFTTSETTDWHPAIAWLKSKMFWANAYGCTLLVAFIFLEAKSNVPIFAPRNVMETGASFYLGALCLQLTVGLLEFLQKIAGLAAVKE